MPRLAAFVCSVSLALLTPLVGHAQRPSSIEGQVIAAGGPIDFEHGSPTLTPEAMATLDRVAALLRARAGIRIVDIEVRSDTRGSAESSEECSRTVMRTGARLARGREQGGV